MNEETAEDRASLSRRRLLTGSGLALGVAALSDAARAQTPGPAEPTPAPEDPDFHDGDPAAEPPMQPPTPYAGAPDW